MPAKSKHDAWDTSATPLELATLAAGFLPKIELPPDWQSEHPTILRDAVSKATDIPPPSGSGYTRPEQWRTSWEVVCEEAVKRAKTLLAAAAGKTRDAVLAWDNSAKEAKLQLSEQSRAAERLREEFDDLARDIPDPVPPQFPDDFTEIMRAAVLETQHNSRELPVARVLKFCLPKVRSDEQRMDYFMRFLEEDNTAFNEKHHITDPVRIQDQGHRMVSRKEFPYFVMGFKAAWAKRGEAWRKEVARNAGEKGGKTTQNNRREKIAQESKLGILNSKEEASLAVAATRSTAHPELKNTTSKKKNAVQ